MTDERDERLETADRVERLVRALLAGRRVDVRPEDAADREVILAAVRLAGAREPRPRMTPQFRRRVAAAVDGRREPGVLSRRTALTAGLGAAFGAVAGAGLARVAGVLTPPAPAPARAPAPALAAAPGAINPRPGRWFDVGPLAAFAENVPVRFQAGAVGSFLVRKGSEVHALSSICTHLPCELEWKASNQQLMCPCHNLGFDTEGTSTVSGDAYPLPPLPRLQVRIVDGRVQVLGA